MLKSEKKYLVIILITLITLFTVIYVEVKVRKLEKKVQEYQKVLLDCVNERSFLFKTDDPAIFEVMFCKRG